MNSNTKKVSQCGAAKRLNQIRNMFKKKGKKGTKKEGKKEKKKAKRNRVQKDYKVYQKF